MKAIILYFRDRRIRKTQENIAYWKTKADILKHIISSSHHMNDDRDKLIEAAAQQARLEVRLASLIRHKEDK